jgi:hypothetical protein
MSALGALLLAGASFTYGQSLAASKQIPVIDGGAGPCSVEFTVTDTKGAPVYDAKVAVRIASGFAGVRKLDLEVGTNYDGKARFSGLPSKVKAGNLFFRVNQGDRSGTALYDPTKSCNAHQDIVISSGNQ